MTAQEFEALVDRALTEVPAELMDLVENCVLLVEDEAPADDPDLLGYYDGIPLTERDSQYSAVLPDRIHIFRNPILRICETPEDVIREVRITVVHEIAHFFGIDDDRLHDLGWA